MSNMKKFDRKYTVYALKNLRHMESLEMVRERVFCGMTVYEWRKLDDDYMKMLAIKYKDGWQFREDIQDFIDKIPKQQEIP